MTPVLAAPRIFAAARSAGASLVEAAGALRVSAAALTAAATSSPANRDAATRSGTSPGRPC